MISILDYGAGNLRSVENALEEIGADYQLIHDADGIRRATKLLLPGVGHFGQMMQALDALRVREGLREQIVAGVPFMGICLGLQALFESSDEAPEVLGLGIFMGRVRRFGGGVRVPHMGWNTLQRRGESRLLRGVQDAEFMYFAHSFFVVENQWSVASCNYGLPYTAVLESGSVFGTQFHPEKSGSVGLRIIRNFVEL